MLPSTIGPSMHALSFDDSNRAKLDSLFADSSSMAGVNNIGNVLVGFRSFFHDKFWRGNSNGNALLFQAV